MPDRVPPHIRAQQRRDHPYEPGVTLDERIARAQAEELARAQEQERRNIEARKKWEKEQRDAAMDRWFDKYMPAPKPPQPPPVNPFDLVPSEDPWGRPVNPGQPPTPAPGAPRLPNALGEALRGIGRRLGS